MCLPSASIQVEEELGVDHATASLASSRAIGDLGRREVLQVIPSESEVEAKKTAFRQLGTKELRRRLNSGQIGRFGDREWQIARSVLSDIAVGQESRRPTANGRAMRRGVLLVAAVALVLVLKALGII